MKQNGDSVTLIPIIIYAVLTWIWFDLNDSNSLPFIGHTDIVYHWLHSPSFTWINWEPIFDFIYFGATVAVCIVIEDIILCKIPLIKFDDYASAGGAGFVYIFLVIYEFFVLEFHFSFILLVVVYSIIFMIGAAIGCKLSQYVRKILNIVDVFNGISDISNDNK